MPTDQPGRKGQEVPFGTRPRQHVARADSQPVEDQGQFVHQGDIEVALRVLDHLGRFRDLDGGRAMDAGRYDGAIGVGDAVQRLVVFAGDDFDDSFQRVFLVAGIDSLRRVAQFEVLALPQARQLSPEPRRRCLPSRRDRRWTRKRRRCPDA